MSKITLTVSGPVGSGKSAVCAKLESLLKGYGMTVEWKGGAEERSLGNLPVFWEDLIQQFHPELEIVEKVEFNEFRDILDRQQAGFARCFEALGIEDDGRERDWSGLVMAINDLREKAEKTKSAQATSLDERIEELILDHSEWTDQGYAIVDSHRTKFAKDLIELVAPTTNSPDAPLSMVPVGFAMKHKTGSDRGFSWVANDLQFSANWTRIPLFTDEQLKCVREKADRDASCHYNTRAKKWRESFDAMHRRAMKAEGTIAQVEAIILDRVRERITRHGDSPTQAFNTPTISHEDAMKYAATQE